MLSLHQRYKRNTAILVTLLALAALVITGETIELQKRDFITSKTDGIVIFPQRDEPPPLFVNRL